jgi:hypothetical protein
MPLARAAAVCEWMQYSQALVRETLPEIIDKVGLPDFPDIVIDSANLGACVFVLDECNGGHIHSPW